MATKLIKKKYDSLYNKSETASTSGESTPSSHNVYAYEDSKESLLEHLHEINFLLGTLYYNTHPPQVFNNFQKKNLIFFFSTTMRRDSSMKSFKTIWKIIV